MTCGAHHHLKRLAAPVQWGLDKHSGKYAVRPLPGPHSKELSIPLKYIIARFLKVANTSKEVDYIISSKMISINGKNVGCGKFRVGLFDIITVKKTNQHFRLYLGANRKFKLHKVSSDESRFRITKVLSKHSYNSIPLTSTLDGFNFKFANPAICIGDTVKVDIQTNKIVDSLPIEVGKVAYVYSGPNAGRIGVVKRVDVSIDGKTTFQIQDRNQKSFNVPSSKVMSIGDGSSTLVSLDENDGVRLNSFELSNIRYAPSKQVEVEDD